MRLKKQAAVLLLFLALAGCNNENKQNNSETEATLGIAAVLPNTSITPTNITNTANAAVLTDTAEGPSDSLSWMTTGNQWNDSGYPMVAQLDVGLDRNLTLFEYRVGNVPFPANALLKLRYKTTAGAWSALFSDSPGGTYDAYKTFSGLGNFSARYIELRFEIPYTTRFNISQIRITEAAQGLAAPTGLNVVAKSSSSITLGWAAVSGATGYNVERNGSVTVPQPAGTTTNVAHTGLSANTSYSFRVQAKNATNVGPWSSAFSATTDPVAVSGDDPATTITSAQYMATNDAPNTHQQKQAGLPEMGIRSAAYTFQFDSYATSRNSTDCGPNTHGLYWVLGPDQKAYPTWHPAKDLVKSCSFGHEHGDNVWNSVLYQQMNSTFLDVRQKRMLPIPFGYAGEVLVNLGQRRVWVQNALDRREDNVGFKIFAEKFLIADRNTADFVTAINPAPGNIVCSAIVAVHQGTHSDDALTAHLHEATIHISCSNGLRVHTTLMSPVGKPGYFSNECAITNANTSANPIPTPTNYPALVFNGTGQPNNTVNNTFVATPLTPYPFNAGERMPFDQSLPVSVAAGASIFTNQIPASVTNFQPDGERVIPSQYCLGTYSWATANRQKYGWNTIENWTFPMTITNAINQSPLMTFRPYAVVINPARVFDDTNNAVPSAKKAWDICAGTLPLGKASDGFTSPDTKTAACQSALAANPSLGWKDPISPYKGTARWMNFKGIVVNNSAGTNTWFSADAFGRKQTTSTNYALNLPEFVSATSFNTSAAWSGSLPDPSGGSTKVCDVTASSTPTDGCYHQSDTKFRKEWWRDYTGSAYGQDFSGVHAPN